MTHSFRKTGSANGGIVDHVSEHNFRLVKREINGEAEYWVDGRQIGGLQEALTALEKPVELSEPEAAMLKRLPDTPFNAYALRPLEISHGLFVKGLIAVEGKIGHITETGKALRDR